MADDETINRGSPVDVIEVRGSRVLVRRMNGSYNAFRKATLIVLEEHFLHFDAFERGELGLQFAAQGRVAEHL